MLLVLTAQASSSEASDKKVIAHQGASGHLPGNTLPSFVLAATTLSDYISMDLVMTRDNHLVVFEDIDITDKTNVAQIFPTRSQQDGRYYAIDFTLAELQQLSLISNSTDHPASLRIPTFVDTLRLLRQMEKILGKTIGIAPEIKKPWFHLNLNKDISSATLDILQRFKYFTADALVFLQCYDPEELQRIHKTLMVSRGIDLKLVQLVDSNNGSENQRLERGKWAPYNSEWMFTRLGTRLLALYADAVGLDKARLLKIQEDSVFADFLTGIQIEEIKIHAFLGSTEDLNISAQPHGYTDLLTKLFEQVNIDALITDSPEATITFLKMRKASANNKAQNQKQTSYITLPLKE